MAYCHVSWESTDRGQPVYDANGYNYSDNVISCHIDPIEDNITEQRHHITCWGTDKQVVVDRSLHCDKQQIEDYIEVQSLFLGCKYH